LHERHEDDLRVIVGLRVREDVAARQCERVDRRNEIAFRAVIGDTRLHPPDHVQAPAVEPRRIEPQRDPNPRDPASRTRRHHPTMVDGLPFSRITRPRMLESPPNIRCQSP
jgi:hypothetical protein